MINRVLRDLKVTRKPGTMFATRTVEVGINVPVKMSRALAMIKEKLAKIKVPKMKNAVTVRSRSPSGWSS